MRTVSAMKMLMALQLLLYFDICSCRRECATYNIGRNNNGKKLYVRSKNVVDNDVQRGDKVSKVNTQKGCLFFIQGSVFGPGTQWVNVKTHYVQCCCEFYNTGYERFLNRHQLTGIDDNDQHFKKEMQKRCIPIDNRPIHTFVKATEQQLKTICGRQNNKVDCMSQDSFTVYDIQRRKDGHYTNVGKVTRQARIVVTCENNSPIHFVGVVDQNYNSHHTCQ